MPPLLPLLARPPLPGLYPRPQLLSALASFISRGGDAKPYKEEEEEESLSALANKFGELPAKATAIGGPLGTMAGTVVPMVMGGGTAVVAFGPYENKAPIILIPPMLASKLR